MRESVQRGLENALGSGIRSASALGGGDINDAYELELQDGRRVFAKTNPRADPAMFPAEARGLDWLRQAGALRIPEVLAAAPEFLALELVRPAPRRADFDERLGRALAALHRHGAPCFGLDHDNFIGRLPQPNAAEPDWATFYRARRLEAQLELAVQARRIPDSLRRRFDRLFQRLPELVGPAEPPARLHGDLWGGNLHVDEAGEPCLIDPAVYGGHREVDLAMMQLFGGFGPRVFAAYAEAYPLADGQRERTPLYQLYPLLVHVNHFGGGYVAGVERALAAYV